MTFSKKFIYIFLLSFFIFLLLLIFYFKTKSNTEVNMKELQTETKETQTETAYTENTLPEPEFYQEAISESLKETMTGKSYDLSVTSSLRFIWKLPSPVTRNTRLSR